MKAIIDDKLYDTDKSELLFAHTKIEWILIIPIITKTKYYKTKNGNYFAVERDYSGTSMYSLTHEEYEFKLYMYKKSLECNPNRYIKEFGEVDEA